MVKLQHRQHAHFSNNKRSNRFKRFLRKTAGALLLSCSLLLSSCGNSCHNGCGSKNQPGFKQDAHVLHDVKSKHDTVQHDIAQDDVLNSQQDLALNDKLFSQQDSQPKQDIVFPKNIPKDNCKTMESVHQLVVHPLKNNIIMAVKATLDSKFFPLYTLCYSDNYGKNWTPKLSLYKVAVDNVDPKFVYGTYENVVYRSDDFGKTFKPVSLITQKLLYSMVGPPIIADHHVSKKIYTISHGESGGIHVSNDGGDSFSFFPFYKTLTIPSYYQKTMQYRKVWDLYQNPKNPLVFYITTEDGAHYNYNKNSYGKFTSPNYDDYYILRTLDGGKTWQPISNGLDWHSLVIRGFPDASGQTRWFANEEGSIGPYILNEKTKKWVSQKQVGGVSLGHITNPNNQAIHYILTWFQIYLSNDYGMTWQPLFTAWSPTPKKQMKFQTFTIDNSGNLYVATQNKGLFKATQNEVSSAAKQKTWIDFPQNPIWK